MGTPLSPSTPGTPHSINSHLSNMVQITGSYTQTSCENYEEFLKALGVGFILRKAAMASTPVMTIEINFELGKEFEEDTTDGRHCKTVVTLEGNKMTTNQKATKSGEKDVVVIREFSDDGLTYTATCDGVSSVQKYKRD